MSSRRRPTIDTTTRWIRIGIPVLLVLVWLVGGSIGGPYFGKVDEVSTNDQSSYLPSSADATKVSERLAAFTGGDTIPAIVVVVGDTALTDAQRAELAAVAADLAAVEGVAGDVSPAVISDDGRAAQIFVPLDADAEISTSVAQLRQVLADDLPAGLQGWVTGPAGFSADLVAGFLGIDGLLLLVALGAVFVILVVVYRSPLLPILVLVTATFALCVALLTVWWLAKAGVLVLNGQVQGILFILVIGAATDYALLYVARFREAIGGGAGRWTATVAAWRGAVEPILASGGTVIAGLLCLLLSDLATNRALGPIASIGIAFAVLSALTFLPALLALFGRVAFWPFIPRTGVADIPDDLTQRVRGLWPRQARLVARRARPIWIVSTIVLLIAAAGVLQLKADGVPASDLVLGASDARDGQNALAEHFPGGSGSPVYVIVPQDRLAQAATVLAADAGIDDVAVSAQDAPSGQATVTVEGGRAVLTSAIPGQPAPAATVSDGDVLLIATLAAEADSAAAADTVKALRAQLTDALGEGTALVGGVTATDVDTNDTSIRDRTLIIPIVLAVILVILMLLLRSILAPVLLILSVIVSFAAALGVSALVFTHVLGFPGADPAVPLYGFVFLVALGIDYNIFLMTRVREESLSHGTRRGILRGLVATGGVITSAGLVLAATFAALGVIPILFLAQLAVIVAFGVLLDTFVVRSLLVPALAYDLGRRIWWPSKLSRRERTLEP
ncbi:MMPL family transporter [Microbacterium sp. SORGH_AS_0888]|uniref:MMPL family transporter n=1 Tax=Microbacterium sp. SORGH_AS_0888 TaxID=3041791 RepID=UPI0027871C65|nr:MMPL family transporter [Microbacterium sp. SORGH_AS_0888]MDQ1130984.1 RND superfamily putative drug exporter [Microbacterium sp. SORGH_AS_0888]